MWDEGPAVRLEQLRERLRHLSSIKQASSAIPPSLEDAFGGLSRLMHYYIMNPYAYSAQRQEVELIRYHDSSMSSYCMDPGSRSSWPDPGGPAATASPVPDELLRAWVRQAEGGGARARELRCCEVQLVRLLEGIRGQRVSLKQLCIVRPMTDEVGWGQGAGYRRQGARGQEARAEGWGQEAKGLGQRKGGPHT